MSALVATLRRSARRHGRIIAGLLAIVLVLLVASTVRLFVRPSTDPIRAVDAVVLFAGGRGERLELAERLMADGVASHLVIPNGNAPEWPAGNAACNEERSYDVHCLTPDPDTTRGEARAIAALAQQQGWETVMVVTSSYHVSRASLLLDRCFDGTVLTAKATPDLGVTAWASRVTHEWLGWTKSVVLERGC